MNIENRLAKLERENRRWRLVAISMAGVLGLSIACTGQWNEPATGLGNQAPAQASDAIEVHDSIQVRRLEIVDEQGRTVSQWDADHLRFWGTDNASDSGAALSADSFMIWKDDRLAWVCGQRVQVFRLERKHLQDGDQLIEGGISATEQETQTQQEFLEPLVGLTAGRAGGGVFIHNNFSQKVASLQSDKTNQGHLMIKDATGEVVHSLNSKAALVTNLLEKPTWMP